MQMSTQQVSNENIESFLTKEMEFEFSKQILENEALRLVNNKLIQSISILKINLVSKS